VGARGYPVLLLLFLLFFISGATGLVFELVWSREFVTVLGGSTRAVSTVLVAFMGGLALGGLWGGKFVDRRRFDPLLTYGLIEGGIGILAPLAPLLLPLARPLLAQAYQTLGGHSPAFEFLRLLLCVLLLLPPTILMGATQPVLINATQTSRARFGMATGRLYTVNTLGAATGAALAGFLLLPALGNRASLLVAGGVNLLICAIVLIFRRRLLSALASGATEIPALDAAADPMDSSGDKRGEFAPGGARPSPLPPGARALVFLGYGISGLAALALQVAWTRSLTLTLGGTINSFTIILITYLIGLTLGGGAITAIVDRLRRPLHVAGALQFLIALSSLAVLPLLDRINGAMFGWVITHEGGLLPLIRFGASFALIAVPTLGMGALLPLLVRVNAPRGLGAGETAGRVLFANTIGAVLGAYLAGSVLLDGLGINGTIRFAAGCSLAIGVGWTIAGSGRSRLSMLLAPAGLGAGLLLMFTLPPPDPLMRNSGPYIYAEKLMGGQAAGEKVRDRLDEIYEVEYFREDGETTVSVFRSRSTGGRSLRINGKVDASSFLDRQTQVLFGHVPLLLHAEPRDVLLLGLASGMSAGSVLSHPIDRLDCLELSPAVREASRLFDDVNQLDASDPRFHLILGDGRNHLALSGERYDVVISEPSNPWQSAMATLFTVEYFELLREALNPGGIAAIWLGIYDMDAETMALIMRSFAAVFPHLALWEFEPSVDYALIGSMNPIRVDGELLAARCRDPRIDANLDAIHFDRDDILAGYTMGEDRVRECVGGGALHRDDSRRLEFDLAGIRLTAYDRRYAEIRERILSRHESAAAIYDPPTGAAGDEFSRRLIEWDVRRDEFLILEQAMLEGGVEPDSMLARCIALREATGDVYFVRHLLDELAVRLLLLAKAGGKEDRREGPAAKLVACLSLLDDHSPEAGRVANRLVELGELEAATARAVDALQRNAGDHLMLAVMARAAKDRGDSEAEADFWERAIAACPSNLIYRTQLARPLLALDRRREAIAQLEYVIDELPRDVGVHVYLGGLLLMEEDLERARFHLRRVLELDPDYASRPQVEAALGEIEAKLGGP
jgi:spermidine synthase